MPQDTIIGFVDGVYIGVLRFKSGFFQKLILIVMVAVLAGCDNELLSRIDQLEAQAVSNAEAGRAFLLENADQSGVITTASGLQYRVLRSGAGTAVRQGDRVEVHYRGTLIDGSEFDSSYSRGEPARFPVQGLIAGWQEALLLMREGDHWQLFVPAELAYGKRSPSPAIAPNSTLIFELELLAIEGR